MKFKLDEKYSKISLYVLGVIILSILFEKILSNIGIITFNLGSFTRFLTKVTAPFIFGISIAYVINPFTRFLETKLLSMWKPSQRFFGIKRVISILLSFLLLFGILTGVFSYIIPEVIISLGNLINLIIKMAPEIQSQLEVFMHSQTVISTKDIESAIQIAIEPLQSISSVSNILSTVILSTMSFAGTMVNLLLGIVIAFYMLKNKEGTAAYMIKVTHLIFRHETATYLINLTRNANKIFEGFFVGKAIDSTIIGILCFFMLSFLKAPYALLSSVIVGITNMIPYFGPFIGAVPVVLITLLYDPMQAVWVSLAILVLQQFDGIILGPKILGDTTGLSPIWVIFAITVGGALFGPLGMLLGVPSVAVVKSLVDSYIDRKYNEKYNQA